MITALIVSLTLLVVCGGIALMLVKVVNILEQAASSVEPPVREIAEPFAPESDEMPAPNQRRRIRAG